MRKYVPVAWLTTCQSWAPSAWWSRHTVLGSVLTGDDGGGPRAEDGCQDGLMLDHLGIQSSDPSRAAVFEAARTFGTEVLHEARLWPEYHPSYYGGFVRDPDGNNVEAVCHTG
jgi:hypothetical protein